MPCAVQPVLPPVLPPEYSRVRGRWTVRTPWDERMEPLRHALGQMTRMTMCSPTRCRSCGLTTWSGCGAHVDQVMTRVPKDQRCSCERGAGRTTRAPRAAGERRSLLARVLGR